MGRWIPSLPVGCPVILINCHHEDLQDLTAALGRPAIVLAPGMFLVVPQKCGERSCQDPNFESVQNTEIPSW